MGQIESSIDIYTLLCVKLGFPGSLNGKASAYNAGDPGLIPGSERSPGVGNGNPLQYSCLENPHTQRSLAGYSPWARKELGMTEHAHRVENNNGAPMRAACKPKA